MAILDWRDKLPAIQWLLSSSDEAIEAIGFIQVILSDTSEEVERKAFHDLVDVLHPVYWRNPFHAGPNVQSFAAVPNVVTQEEALALLPQAPDGSKLKKAIAFLVEHSDEAIQIVLTLLALFGRKAV